MPGPTVEEIHHETIESPYRLSWKRVGKVIIPLLLIVLAISYWFLYMYIPNKIALPDKPTMIPTIKVATPSAKKATPSSKKKQLVGNLMKTISINIH